MRVDCQTVASLSSALTERRFTLIATSRGDARAHGRAVGAAIVTQSMQKR
jgi:hypothetical protein